ncbi:hypothetical protein SDC9_204616 [bioreactor metagenome]|uniref:Uncharacterized protein n=1 Tax=bioreactor metagenome TaxID=1076179 RepID=A0A645JBK9_9ZZZZ
MQASLYQGGNVIDQAKILGIQHIGTQRILLDGICPLRGSPLSQFIGPAAGLGAFASVRVAASNVGAEQAAAGVGYAHGSVDESLIFHADRALLPQMPHLGDGELPRQHNPADSLLLPKSSRLRIEGIGLGAKVQRHIRQ